MKRFEEVVNRDFLDKYLPQIRPEYGFIDKNGQIIYSKIEKVFYSINGGEYPYRFVYALIHGMNQLIPSWNIPPKFRDQEDRIYKACLDRGKRWQDILGNDVSKDILL